MTKYYSQYKRYYQAILNTSDSSIHHYEMLLRKHDGTSAFMDILLLEKQGKIHELDLSNVTYAVSEINRGRVDHPIAINISSESLARQGFFEAMCEPLKTCKNRQLISIELTETGKTPDIPMFREFFEILQDEGIKISADDFSCGFMNEQVVMSLPFDNIKIDKALIHGMMSDSEVATRVTTLVEYAKNNEITLTAEFVDSKDIYDKVKSLGIDFIQGYYLAEPTLRMHRTNDTRLALAM